MRFAPGRSGHAPGDVKDCWRLKPRLLAFGHKARLRGLGRILAALSGLTFHKPWITRRRVALSGRVQYAALLVLWSVIAGCGSAPVGYQPPQGWQAIPLPTTQLSAQYAISPDVPGLIVGCVGDKLGGPANLWSTSDGGAHWRQFPFAGLLGGCELAAPAGGQGAIFLLNFGASAEQQALKVSHDAGRTWRTVATSFDFESAAVPDGYGILQQLFDLISAGVYRGGRLYTISQLDTTDANFSTVPAFSVSNDDGRTWTKLESGTDPLAAQQFMPLGIAPDYRSPDAWFRLLGPDEQGQPAQPVLEHSGDGGRTWTVVGSVGPAGTFGNAEMATLATTPAQPSRLCVGIAATVAENTSALAAPPFAPASRFGPPYMPPRDIALAGSDDGGLTWNSASIVQQSHIDNLVSGVFINSAGTCFLAEDYMDFGDSDPDIASIWQLAPGASAQPERSWQVQHQIFTAFVMNAGGGKQHPRFVAIAATYHQHTTPDGYAISATEPARLIWTDAP